MLLDVVGVFSQITQIVSSTGLDAGGFDLKNVLSLTTVVSGVTIFSIVEVVIFTLLATIAALIYNVVSSLVGGVHVTLGDDTDGNGSSPREPHPDCWTEVIQIR